MQTTRLCTCLVPTYAKFHRPRLWQSARRLVACGRWTKNVSSQNLAPISQCSYTTEAMAPAAVEGQDKNYPVKIQTLVDEISQLTLIEVADLNELLKKTLKITDTPVMAMGAMPATKEEEEEEQETKQEKSSYTVNLTAFDSAKKVALIKQIKALVPGMNLVQAKKFVESTPQIVRADLSKPEAEELLKAVEAAGGTAELT